MSDPASMEQRVLQMFKVPLADLKQEITDLCGSIRDPERAQTLTQLSVIHAGSVEITPLPNTPVMSLLVSITPTVPHCHLTQQIGLAIRRKIELELPADWQSRLKLHIKCSEGSHQAAEEIEKQVNDKERTAAALENADIAQFIDSLIKPSY